VLPMRYPMYVMPIATLLDELTELRPHQELLADDKLVKASAMTAANTIFVSHQWLGFNHPDPNNVQLRELQKMLRRLLKGKTSVASAKYYGVASLDIRRVTADEWPTRLQDAYVWFDYMCALPSRTACFRI
jgi:hypothetical protein